MAFDADAFFGDSPAPAKPSAFDADAFFGDSAPAAKATKEPDEEPGIIESGLRGIKQGVTLGFGDEITGALESAFTSKTYKQARDEARAADSAAKEAHGVTFGLGQILGGVATSVVPGAGLAKLGTGIAGSIARGAATGIATGAGESEAEGVPGIVQDAAKGGLVGGAAGAVGHGLSRILGGAGGIVGGAPARADRNIADTVLEKVPATVQDKAIAKLGGRQEIATVLRSEGLEKAAKSPEALNGAVKKKLNEIGGDLGKFYREADKASPGMSFEKLETAIRGVREKYAADLNADAVTALDRELKKVGGLASRGTEDAGAGVLVTARQAHALSMRYGRAGFGGNYLNPSDARVIGRDLNAAVRGALQEHVAETGGDVAALKALNERYSRLASLGDVVKSKAVREARNSPTLGQRLDTTGKALAVGASLAHGGPTPILGYLALKGAPVLSRAGTAAMAKLVRAAHAGEPTAKLIEGALAAGVPRGTIEAVVSGVGQPAVSETP